MRLARRIVLRILCAGLLVAAVALLARFVLHGPVDGRSLQRAVVRESGSADAIGSLGDPCRRAAMQRTWTCVVGDSEGSGSVTYRVRVRRDSSCWDGRIVFDDAELPMPEAISGCVHLWQWTLLDLVL